MAIDATEHAIPPPPLATPIVVNGRLSPEWARWLELVALRHNTLAAAAAAEHP